MDMRHKARCDRLRSLALLGLYALTAQGSTARASSKAGERSSRAVFEQTVEVKSLAAQHFMKKRFYRTQNALFSLSVVMRAIADGEHGNLVEKCESEAIASMKREMRVLDLRQAGFVKLMEDNGVNAMPAYSKPRLYNVEITSPHSLRMLNLLSKLDGLVGSIDCLWLNGILGSKERNAHIVNTAEAWVLSPTPSLDR